MQGDGNPGCFPAVRSRCFRRDRSTCSRGQSMQGYAISTNALCRHGMRPHRISRVIGGNHRDGRYEPPRYWRERPNSGSDSARHRNVDRRRPGPRRHCRSRAVLLRPLPLLLQPHLPHQNGDARRGHRFQLHASLHRKTALSPSSPLASRFAAVVSLALWFGIVFTGLFFAFTAGGY